MPQPQGGEEAVVGRRVAGLRVADDDRRAVDRGRFQEAGRADELLGLDLAPLVVVAERLAGVEICFQDPARPQAADVGGGDVVEVPQPGVAGEVEHVPGSGDVGEPRLGGPVGPPEAEARRVVEHLVAVAADPVAGVVVESAEGPGEVALQNNRPGELQAEHLLPLPHEPFDAGAGRFPAIAADDECQPTAGSQQIADEVGAEQAGRAGDEEVIRFRIQEGTR